MRHCHICCKAIAYEFPPNTTLVCGHLLCWECDLCWATLFQCCPICRQPMDPGADEECQRCCGPIFHTDSIVQDTRGVWHRHCYYLRRERRNRQIYQDNLREIRNHYTERLERRRLWLQSSRRRPRLHGQRFLRRRRRQQDTNILRRLPFIDGSITFSRNRERHDPTPLDVIPASLLPTLEMGENHFTIVIENASNPTMRRIELSSYLHEAMVDLRRRLGLPDNVEEHSVEEHSED